MNWCEFDPLEFLIETEEHFGVAISEKAAERCDTVGDLYVYLLSRTNRSDQAPCPTSQAFYSFRRTLSEVAHVRRNWVRPAVQVRDLLGAGVRGPVWPRLVAALDLPDPPDPDPTPWVPAISPLTAACIAIAAATCLTGLFLAFPGREPVELAYLVWPLTVLLGGLIWAIYWASGREVHRVTIPTVQDLVVRLTAKPDRQTILRTTSHPVTVWAELTAILSRHVHVTADCIRSEHRFAQLGSLRESMCR